MVNLPPDKSQSFQFSMVNGGTQTFRCLLVVLSSHFESRLPFHAKPLTRLHVPKSIQVAVARERGLQCAEALVLVLVKPDIECLLFILARRDILVCGPWPKAIGRAPMIVCFQATLTHPVFLAAV